ncbi:unnamed protein product [Danaus chrysippus]|uniref:(African queen) hypothetical protein n=1 Tax=Danaus chrysippus TaxID=151541 RepID=A0A8J2QQI0_9NEOP|nr:unnamed protein product [Danaus chrysippus]
MQVRCESDNEMMTNMKNSLYESMNSRYSSVKKLPSLMVATILDPRFKSMYLNSNEVDIVVTELISFLTESEGNKKSSRNTDNDNANVSVASTSTCVPQAHSIQQEKESLWDVHDNTSSQTETTESEGTNHFLKEKIQSYLSEPLLQRNADIYSYWNCSPYPILRSAVLKYLSATPTSVRSEQLFSAVGQIYSDRDNNLNGENVEKLLFMAYNI